MKSTFFLFLAAFILSATTNAQSTVDSITAKYKLIPMPGALTLEKSFPVIGSYQLGAAADATSMANGTSTATEASSSVTITLDSVNKGIVWVEGLPQGKFKAYLKKSPSTYRILAQKTENGKQIPEGTLLFDPATGALNIALGKAYDEADPAAIFTMNAGAAATDATADNTVKVKVKTPSSKSKNKVTFFTATKVQTNVATEPAANGSFDAQLQQAQQTQTQQ